LQPINDQSLPTLFGNFGKSAALQKIPYVQPMTEKALEEIEKPNPLWSINILQAFINAMKLENAELKKLLIPSVMKLAARLTTKTQEHKFVIQGVNGILDAAEVSKNSEMTEYLYEKAFELADFCRNEELLPALSQRFDQAKDLDKIRYIPLLTRKSLTEKNDAQSPWPENTLERLRLALIPDRDGRLKYEAAFGIYTMLAELEKIDRKWSGTWAAMRQIAGAAHYTHDPQGMYGIAFHLAEGFDDKEVMPLFLDKFEKELSSTKAVFIDPFMTRVEKMDHVSEWLNKVENAFIAVLPDEQLQAQVIEGLKEIAEKRLASGEAPLSVFSALMKMAKTAEDNERASELYHQSFDLLDLMVCSKTTTLHNGADIALIVVNGLDVTKPHQDKQYKILELFVSSKDKIVIDETAELQQALQNANSAYAQNLISLEVNKENSLDRQYNAAILNYLQHIGFQ